MKRISFLLLFCLAMLTASPQIVSRNYRNKPLTKVLIDLRKSTSQYKIAFIHNDLEDYKVTKRIDRLTIPEAIHECIGFYPISMKVEGDSLVFVEAMLKTELKLIGRIIDKGKRPIAYANITLLNVGDSATISSGVSNENG
ncbi:MAG: carboxypeptidase regulatory-like domain-containing protein, partial [Prevotella sp.]|nr:carboxypeptidase regulatory-like domain-containing protein [Prevotella sp.]